MFATRNHDENAIYDQQTTAAAKSLNQGGKGLAPKTPGAKTPFKSKSHDENATYGPGKTAGKGDIKRDTFVTPAGPRNRAPLGDKTTNARAGAFKPIDVDTVGKQNVRNSSPKLRRAKIKIHQADPLSTTSDEDYPEIEYMPPRETPLSDPPEEVTQDEFPELRGKNFTRGWSMIGAPKPLTFEQEREQWQAKYKLADQREKRAEQAKKLASVSTLKAKDAASALSIGAKNRPTASSVIPKIRPTSTMLSKKVHVARPAAASHTTARVVSNTTLGYAKGRSVSASSRAQLSQVHAPPDEKVEQAKPSFSISPFKPGTNLHGLLLMDNIEDEQADHEEEEANGGVLLDLDAEIDALLPDFKLGPLEE